MIDSISLWCSEDHVLGNYFWTGRERGNNSLNVSGSFTSIHVLENPSNTCFAWSGISPFSPRDAEMKHLSLDSEKI